VVIMAVASVEATSTVDLIAALKAVVLTEGIVDFEEAIAVSAEDIADLAEASADVATRTAFYSNT